MGKGLGFWGALAGAAILGIAVFIAYQGGGETGPASDPNNPAQVAKGKALYAEACASCHGADLKGEPDWKQRKPDGLMPAPPHDDTGHTWHHADDFLFGYTKFGGRAYAPKGYKSGMPGFAEQLSDADIWAVLAFIKSQWSERSRAQQARISAQAR